MANVSEWSANELENLFLDDMNLSDERGRRAAKIMAAVKAKEDEQDAKIDAVAGGLVFRGTKATYADLEAVEDPAVGDMYSVTGLGGENYAWDGEAWDALGTSDANVVHKTGNETISGEKTFSNKITFEGESFCIARDNNTSALYITAGRTSNGTHGANLTLYGGEKETDTGVFLLRTAGPAVANCKSFKATNTGSLSWDGQAIQTSSDERLKTGISVVDDAVLDAWGAVQWRQFKFRDAVELKGENARLHLGLIAQHVKQVFEDRGLDACAYGILCHEVYENSEDRALVELWMVRYEEAQAMEAAYQRRCNMKLEERIAALEAALNGNDK